MREFGVIGINVNRVTRIHNRFLRNRFEEKLETLVDPSDSSYKRNLEYLFMGVDPDRPESLFKIVEEGFKAPEEYEYHGLPAYVSLVNSVASAEMPRIYAAKRKSQYKNETISSGKILVCKIFLLKTTQDNAYPNFSINQSPSEAWRLQPILPPDNHEYQSIFRVKQSDPKQRLWFILDNALALPEYLVEFDYI